MEKNCKTCKHKSGDAELRSEICRHCYFADIPSGWEPQEAMELDWINWTGGECPVPAGHDVSMRLEDGDVVRNNSSEEWCWYHHGSVINIVAYYDHTAAEQEEKAMDIWKEAPDGATHYNPVSDEFMRIENNQWVAWIKGEWEWVIPVGEMRSKIIKRPEDKAGTNENAPTDNTRTPFGDLIYCLGCWRDAEAEDNLGDAHEWLHHVRRSFDAYLDWESAQDASQDKPQEWMYPWDQAPDWASYAATDKCGTRRWHENKPNTRDGAVDSWIEGGSHKEIKIEVSNFSESLQTRPEQLAAEKEREEAIDSMIAACPYPGSNSTKIDCAALYDAGCRLDTKGDV